MKALRFLILLLLIQSCGDLEAQYKWENPSNQHLQVVKGQAFCEELHGTYFRLPERTKDKVGKALWDLSRNSAGLSISFYSNAPTIKVRYKLEGGYAMPHMPATGVSGLDLYARDVNGMQRWCGFKYHFADTITYTFNDLSYTTDSQRGNEYQLFLPLYNTVRWMEIGVPDDASFSFIPATQERPIVVYGTSIAQGACASRPGMAWSNIVGRTTDCPIINLAFSGNGKLEPQLFNLLSEIDAQMFIIDCIPNLSGDELSKVIYQRTIDGVKKLREKTTAPILLAEHAGYTNEYSSDKAKHNYQVANIELRKAYDTLQKENVEEVYYLNKEQIGLSMDGAVEGIHPNDFGMQQYADCYISKIKEILKMETKTISTCIPKKQNRDSYDWNERHENVLKLNKEKNPDILMIGNSITHFWAGEPTFCRQNGKDSWNKLFKGKQVSNLGFGWDKVENVLWRIYHGELDGYQAKEIVLAIGTNNLQSNNDEEIIQGIELIVKAIKQRQTKANVTVIGIYPRQNMEERIALYNEKLEKAMEQENVTFLNLSYCFKDKNGNVNWKLFSDGLHPNSKGYSLIAKALKAKY